MNRPLRIGLPLAAGLAFALWLLTARQILPLTDRPALPFEPQAMSLDQILIGFGMMPRGVIALLAGAALGLSGAILQLPFNIIFVR